MTDVIRIRAIQLTPIRRASDMSEVDAATARYLADVAAERRRRQDLRLATWLAAADALPPGGPFPDAFTAGQERPAGYADTGNHNRHRRRRMAAKARH